MASTRAVLTVPEPDWLADAVIWVDAAVRSTLSIAVCGAAVVFCAALCDTLPSLGRDGDDDTGFSIFKIVPLVIY